MRHPLIMFFRVHHLSSYLGAAAGAALVSMLIAQVPLPQAGAALVQDYARAVGFMLGPLLLVPAVGLVLGGDLDEMELLSSRRLMVFRLGLIGLAAATAIVALLPSAAIAPSAHAVRVMIENLLVLFAASIILGCWIPPQWVWAPVFALGAVGIMGPEQGIINTMVVIDRTRSDADLIVGSIALVLGCLLYGIRGAAQRDGVAFRRRR